MRTVLCVVIGLGICACGSRNSPAIDGATDGAAPPLSVDSASAPDLRLVEGSVADAGGIGGTGGTSAAINCAALAAPTGTIVSLSPANAASLPSLVAAAATDTTLLLAPGTYVLGSSLAFHTPRVTLRSSTDNAADVILDGNYAVNETVVIQANDVTIAHVTIRRAVDHPIHISPPDGTTNVVRPVIYGVHFEDGGEQFLKVNANAARTAFVDDGRVECSSFLMTDAGRSHVEDLGNSSCYTGGIDVHAARGWQIRSNHFQGIYCTNGGLAEHAIHMWNGCRDTIIENNTVVDCARGIGLGMGSGSGVSLRTWSDAPYGGAAFGHIDGIVRNNVIWAAINQYDTGIEIAQARRPVVVNNTVMNADGLTGFFSSIDYRFTGTVAVIQNNLTRRITARDGATGTVDHNVQNAAVSSVVNAAGGDFHLSATAATAIDQGAIIAESGVDMDGEPHSKGAPDIGADER